MPPYSRRRSSRSPRSQVLGSRSRLKPQEHVSIQVQHIDLQKCLILLLSFWESVVRELVPYDGNQRVEVVREREERARSFLV